MQSSDVQNFVHICYFYGGYKNQRPGFEGRLYNLGCIKGVLDLGISVCVLFRYFL